MAKKKSPKLSIELVPETCWMSNVRSCVSPADWDVLRKECYSQAGHKCEICGGQGSEHPVECHEVWSYAMKTKIQKLERLIALCPNCHEVKHIGLAEMNGRQQIALAHLLIVNDWNMEELKAHYDESFKEWHKRNEIEWKLDITFLEKKKIRYELDREPPKKKVRKASKSASAR